MWGGAERAGTVQPGEKRAQGRNHLISVFKFLLGRSEEHTSIVPSGRTRDSKHKHKYIKFLLNSFLWELSNTGTCCPERLLSLHPCGDTLWYSNPDWTHCRAACSSQPFWAGDWTRWPPKTSSSLNYSTFQLFYIMVHMCFCSLNRKYIQKTHNPNCIFFDVLAYGKFSRWYFHLKRYKIN